MHAFSKEVILQNREFNFFIARYFQQNGKICLSVYSILTEIQVPIMHILSKKERHAARLFFKIIIVIKVPKS